MRLAVLALLLSTVTVSARADNGSCEAGQVEVVLSNATSVVRFQDQLNNVPDLAGKAKTPKEGSLLPGTYCFLEGTRRAEVVRRMRDAMTQLLAKEWKLRHKDAAVNTPEEAIILASVVEAEKPGASEWPMIAAVYSNRLRRGMKLQADATIIYAKTKGRPLGRRITLSELQNDNGYNTYQRKGLPKGPITNPSAEAIRAVLNPEKTSALFFVADGTGGHVFADTLEQHNANVEKWYAIRRQRGEM